MFSTLTIVMMPQIAKHFVKRTQILICHHICVIWLDIIIFFIYKGYIMKIVELTNTQSRLETHAVNNIHSYEVVKGRWRRRNKVIMWNNDLTSAYVVIYHQIHSVISLALKSIKKLIWNDIIVCGSFGAFGLKAPTRSGFKSKFKFFLKL